MKNIILSSVVSALLLLSGCSSSEPVVDETSSQVKEKPAEEVVAIETETVAEDNAEVKSENVGLKNDTAEIDMISLEKELSSVYFDFDK